jgi:hypothetical protein
MPIELTCQQCGLRLRLQEDVGGDRLTCPRCLTPLLNPASKVDQAAPLLEAEVRGDGRKSLGLIGILTVLCVIGIIGTFVAGASTEKGHWAGLAVMGYMAPFFVALDLLVIIQAGRGLWKKINPAAGADPAERFWRMMGFLALLLVAGVAIFVVFLFTCAGVGSLSE